MTRWWHLKVLRHRIAWRQILKATTVVTCQCGSQWVEPVGWGQP